MNQFSQPRSSDALDLAVLATLVREHLTLDVPEEVIDEILREAEQGNGPAEYITGTWWERLAYVDNARYWFERAASHYHAPAAAKLKITDAQ